MQLDELLIECIDALSVPTWDNSEREDHLHHIGKALHSGHHSEEICVLLSAAAVEFEKHQNASPIELAFSGTQAASELATAIEARVGSKKYVYHGTVFGRLEDISREGLMPGKNRVWPEQYVDGEFLASATFFAETWRGAMSWAEIARSKSRGPKSGRHRTPVVIRINAAELTLQPDPAAVAPGCLMVRGQVSADGAEVIVDTVRGFPRWQPITEALTTKRRRTPLSRDEDKWDRG